MKLSLLQPFTDSFQLDNFNYKPEIFTSENARKKADMILSEFGIKQDDLFVTMSPTHKRDTRRWKFKHFMETAKYLTEKYGAKVMLTYGPGEKDYILSNAPEMPSNVFLMPELKLGDFVALIGRAKLHVGNDSAPHHIATAQNVPTFIILGSSSDGWVYDSPQHTSVALGLECQPCKKAKCKISDDIPCMKDLSFDIIKDRLDSFIKDNRII
ncbi:MAG: hypothetical protein C0602_09015 [Denitrovibrio sp.]|nr:MAG: hypothetical protein C0602_09015 [Denitrovibrio sp.]